MTVRRRLERLVTERYGRDGDVLERGWGVTPYEAGIVAAHSGWWALEGVLARLGTTFQAVHVEVRLDLLFRDLLEHPDDAPSVEWARRYGYCDASAVSRAFRTRFRTSLGDARRMVGWGPGSRQSATSRGAPAASHGAGRRTPESLDSSARL